MSYLLRKAQRFSLKYGSITPDNQGHFVHFSDYDVIHMENFNLRSDLRNAQYKYDSLRFGKVCVEIAKRANMTAYDVHNQVIDYCSDHYQHFEFYPADMEIGDDGILISNEGLLEILNHHDRFKELSESS